MMISSDFGCVNWFTCSFFNHTVETFIKFKEPFDADAKARPIFSITIKIFILANYTVSIAVFVPVLLTAILEGFKGFGNSVNKSK